MGRVTSGGMAMLTVVICNGLCVFQNKEDAIIL